MSANWTALFQSITERVSKMPGSLCSRRESHQDMRRKEGKLFSSTFVQISLDSDLLITAIQSSSFQTHTLTPPLVIIS